MDVLSLNLVACFMQRDMVAKNKHTGRKSKIHRQLESQTTLLFGEGEGVCVEMLNTLAGSQVKGVTSPRDPSPLSLARQTSDCDADRDKDRDKGRDKDKDKDKDRDRGHGFLDFPPLNMFGVLISPSYVEAFFWVEMASNLTFFAT